MKGSLRSNGFKGCRNPVIFFCVLMGLSLGLSQMGHTADSGLSLTLYTGTSAQTYALGDPVPVTMVYKNEAPWPLSTIRLFPESPFHQSIIVTDPSGERHKPEPETEYDDMPPPVSWDDGKKVRELLPAELLPKGWVKSVEIADLTDLIPVMKEVPGTYIIDAKQQFIRFAWTVDLEPHGLMGIADDKRNWQGTVQSENQIKIVINPPSGAKLGVRVLDRSSGNPEPVRFHDVRVYEGSDLNLSDAWSRGDPVITGTSRMDGWVQWHSGDPCLQMGDYTVVAKYRNEFGQETVGTLDAGWTAGECTGEFVRRIFFGAPAEKYSVFATNSVYVRNKAKIISGAVGAPNESTGPVLSSDVEVDIGENVLVEDGNKIIGHRVGISSTASVYDLYYNFLEDAGGEIRGEECSPLDTCDAVVWQFTPPDFPSIKPGQKKDDLVIPSGEQVILPYSGDSPNHIAYDDVELGSSSVLILQGGAYHFMNLYVGSDSSIICKAPTEIRIQGRLYPGTKAYIGPGGNPAPTAKDVVIYVAGENGKKGELKENPKAADIGQGCIVKANIYAPNGTLLIEEGCRLQGAFIAKDVVVGMKTAVELESYFQE